MTIAWHLIVFIKQKYNFFFFLQCSKWVSLSQLIILDLNTVRKYQCGRWCGLTSYTLFIMTNMQRQSSAPVFFRAQWEEREPAHHWENEAVFTVQGTSEQLTCTSQSISVWELRLIKKKKIIKKIREPFVDGAPFISPSLLVSQLQCPTCAWQNCNRDLGSSRT